VRRKKEEMQVMWDEYLEQRKLARMKEEEDLKKLKERQVSIYSKDLSRSKMITKKKQKESTLAFELPIGLTFFYLMKFHQISC